LKVNHETYFLFIVFDDGDEAKAGQCQALIDQMENMGELKKILRCLDNNTANAASPKPKPFQRSTIKTKQIVEGYLFEVEHCARSTGDTACTLVLTNKNKQIYSPDYREFGILPPTATFLTNTATNTMPFGHKWAR
jgi:hypothetical protein